jgi:hypothetical protein
MRGLKPIGVAACLGALLISAFAIVWRYDPVIPAISSLSMPSLFKALAAIKPAAIGAICVDLAALVAWFTVVKRTCELRLRSGDEPTQTLGAISICLVPGWQVRPDSATL